MAFTLPAEAQRLASLPDRARRIRSARVGAELSMTVVAAACGFSVSCLSHYESGRHAMSDRQVARVMAAITTLARREPSS
ncbi:MAG: helix-turn-helix transcriptional regulator, partial [Chloroflexota bacterium]